MSDPRVLLFDLGYVLVDVVWVDDLVDMQAVAHTPEETESRYHAFEPYLRFEAGELSAAEFGEAFAQAWPLKVEPAEFLVRFSGWTTALYPGVIELLASLRGRFRLAALSNSNELHWRYMQEALGVQALFERAFSSHEAKLRKPDAGFYLHAARELDVQPSEVCFFDDKPENVEAARAVGMQAHQVQGVDELRACLMRLGHLDAPSK